MTTSQSQAAVPETPEVTATPAPTATPEPTAAPAENTDKKDNATSEPTKTNKPSSGASTSGGTTKPAATKTPAPAPAATPAPTAKPQVKYTFTVRRHEATCTTQGYDEHICHEWGGMNYNDRFVPTKGHSWDGGTVTKAATYTETGIKTFKCKECDETRTEEIPSLNKTYHIKNVVAPTCTAEGYTIYECNEVPGLTYKGDYKAKLPHAYDAGKVTKPATIYEKGVKTFTCTSCGTTYTEDIPMVEKTWHKGNTVAPTCTEQGYTVYICDQDSALTEKRDYTNALGHAWDAGTVTTAATCTKAGVKTYTCTRNGCTETKTEEIAALGHKWDDGTVTTPATCEAVGVKTYKCQNTGCTETKTEEIAALGHKWDDGVVTKEATYEEDGERTYTCQNDKTHVHKEVIPALGYTFTETVVAPTCTEDGYTLHTCNENPAKTYKDTPVPALGHQYKEVTTPATCGALGSVDNVCERCNDKQHVKNLPVTGEHQWDEGVITKEPTATETGIKTYTCNVCKATKTEDIAKAHNHDYTRLGEIIEGPYCETEGKRWMYCSYEGCNERVLMPVPAIGYHDWDTEHTECLKKATCTEKGTMRMHCKRDASHTMTYDYGGTGHIWDEGVITTPPTYDEYGEKTLYCKNCNATKTEKVLPTKYTFTVTVVPPTCTEDGYTMHKCNEDDSFSYKDNIVHSTGHRAAKRVIEPTCKEEGRTEIYCKVCGDVSSTFDFTPKKGHTWDNGVVTTEPTAEKEGVKTYTCTVCNETKTETIPRLNGSGK
ncbi:hypothetical protein [Gemmiger formicilis]|uniref:hypothetical protein n=1 Tax=Gemmiger formicilis TaxID=745368 RepID=UPI00351F864F